MPERLVTSTPSLLEAVFSGVQGRYETTPLWATCRFQQGHSQSLVSREPYFTLPLEAFHIDFL